MLLQAENISKKYQQVSVIKNFSFTLDYGEIVVLTGRSGTGKTTFMRLLNNLEKTDQGTITLAGNDLCTETESGAAYVSQKRQKNYQKQIGMVFQDYALFPHLTVKKNLLEGPLAQRAQTSKEELEKKAEKLLFTLGINDQKEKLPAALSGGQKQRAAIARALMLNPQVLCFDEPTSALDRTAADSIGRLIQEIAAQGTGILVVTHDLPFAKSYSTRIISSETFSKLP